jgi:parvulin-like peptidyl-prolyl isomerase
MKPLWIQAFSLLLLGIVGAVEGQEMELVDRIVAVVDEDPILESDLDRAIGLGLVEAGAEESEESFRRRVLNQVIEEKLRFHEIDRFGFSEISLSDVDRAYGEIKSRFRDEDAFAESLDALGITSDELRQLVARQLMVLTYVDERLGARVFVSVEDIQRYYEETLLPELRARGERIPDLDSVREQIRAVLKEQRLNEEITAWTEELRREADIEDYFDERKPGVPETILRSEEG